MNGIVKKNPASPIGTHHVRDQFEMRQLADIVAADLSAGDVLLLKGDLGSGKTTFVKSLATVLGAEEMVTSPTFTIAAEYDLPGSHIANQLVHLDLYRLEQVEGEDLSYINEILRTAKQLKRLIAIEWADRLEQELPRAWNLSFRLGEKGTERIVTIRK